MKLKINKQIYFELIEKLKFRHFKRIFFFLSLFYFCFYFFENLNQISFNIDPEKNEKLLFLSFLFCILSIYSNAFAWKNIVLWFGKNNVNNNLVSFYVLTNILKYVPGGIWHFVERFNYIKKIRNSLLAFYSTLVEPYFMLCASSLVASLGIFFSPFYFILIIPSVFLNRKLIYLILEILESLKVKAVSVLKNKNPAYQLEKKISLNSFFPLRAFLYEIAFVVFKFIGFFICYNTVNSFEKPDVLFLLVSFCISWAIGLIVPTAPSGIGVFEACFLFLVGKSLPQNIVFTSLIYFRLISTSADLFLSLPFLVKKLFKLV